MKQRAKMIKSTKKNWSELKFKPSRNAFQNTDAKSCGL